MTLVLYHTLNQPILRRTNYFNSTQYNKYCDIFLSAAPGDRKNGDTLLIHLESMMMMMMIAYQHIR